VPHGQRDGSLWPCSRISRSELLLFLPSSSSVVFTRLSGPCSRPTTSQKNLLVPGIEPGHLRTFNTLREMKTNTTLPHQNIFFIQGVTSSQKKHVTRMHFQCVRTYNITVISRETINNTIHEFTSFTNFQHVTINITDIPGSSFQNHNSDNNLGNSMFM
jgi:hypothetical protein